MKQRKPGALLILGVTLMSLSIFASNSLAQVSMPRIDFQQKTLPNGMRLHYASAGEKGKPLILFDDEWNLKWALQNETALEFHEVAP